VPSHFSLQSQLVFRQQRSRKPPQILVDRDSCINSNNAATPEPAIAACTRLLEALARGEISGPEGAAVHVARGNLHAVQGDVDRGD